ncbi:hypothetical protein AGMMS50296_8720 [Alphaproteobacteria bacterium]|nr:hypothetical protein AGMMS50296_8720 [Alphaproteobacteria bacterium]
MMLALGDYFFSGDTASYQNKAESRNYRWEGQNVIGQCPLYHYMGPGEQDLKLDGVIYADYHAIDGYTLSPKESRITAHAADFLENFKNPQARSFTETHLSEIVQKIASEHGLEAKIAPALTNIRLENLHQTAESDLHFLTRLGQQYNVLIKPSGHCLVAMPMGKGISPTGAALPWVTLTPDSVMSWSLQCSKKEEVSSVTAKGYDTDSAEEFHETIGDEDDSDENMGYSLRGLYPTREAAKVAAQAVYEKLMQKAYTFSAEIPGNPQVLAESKLTLQGFRPGIPTDWILSRSSHSLSSSGYKTSLEAMVPTEYQKLMAEKDKA